jgi:hypothetical protein
MRSGIHSVTEVPSWIFQRYSQGWRRGALAVGWAALYALLDTGLARLSASTLEGSPFPVQWRIFLALCILLGGLWKPLVGYALFIAAIAYPLYLISVYVMALALAVLILTAPLVARFLPLALVVIGAPLLAPLHLTPIVPLLAGLWTSSDRRAWGAAEAAVAGGLAALWLKVCAGVSGGPLDLWLINGWSLEVAPVYERLHTANSLETLVRLGAPFVSDPAANAATALLFNVLQVAAWAGAAYVVAAVQDVLLSRKIGRAGQGGAWTSVLCLVPGLVLIWAGYVVGASWLQVPGPRWLDPPWLPAQVVLVGAVVVGIDGLLRYLRQPLLARQPPVRVAVPVAQQRPPRRAVGRGQSVQDSAPRILEGSGEQVQVRAQDGQAGGKVQSSKERRRQGDDIIMIELD